MNSGYITLSRRLFDSDLWREPRPRTRLEAWLDLIQLAAFAPHPVQTASGVVTIQRGEVLASLRFLSTRWLWSVKQARGFLENLRRTERIRAQREAQSGTVYLIVNYDFYQTGGTPEDTATGIPEGTARAQQGHKDKKVNKGKKESQNSASGSEDAVFEAIYAALPKRLGGHNRKATYNAYRASIRRGADPDAMLAGAKRYAVFCDAMDRTGTEYVKQGATFLGPQECWLEEWQVPLTVSRSANGTNTTDPTRSDYVGVVDGWMSPELERLTRPRAS